MFLSSQAIKGRRNPFGSLGSPPAALNQIEVAANLKSGKWKKAIYGPADAYAVNDGRLCTLKERIRVFDCSTERQLHALELPENPLNLTVNKIFLIRNRVVLLRTNSDKSRFDLWIEHNKELKEFGTHHYCKIYSFANELFILIASQENTCSLVHFNVETLQGALLDENLCIDRSAKGALSQFYAVSAYKHRVLFIRKEKNADGRTPLFLYDPVSRQCEKRELDAPPPINCGTIRRTDQIWYSIKAKDPRFHIIDLEAHRIMRTVSIRRFESDSFGNYYKKPIFDKESLFFICDNRLFQYFHDDSKNNEIFNYGIHLFLDLWNILSKKDSIQNSGSLQMFVYRKTSVSYERQTADIACSIIFEDNNRYLRTLNLLNVSDIKFIDGRLYYRDLMSGNMVCENFAERGEASA